MSSPNRTVEVMPTIAFDSATFPFVGNPTTEQLINLYLIEMREGRLTEKNVQVRLLDACSQPGAMLKSGGLVNGRERGGWASTVCPVPRPVSPVFQQRATELQNGIVWKGFKNGRVQK